MNSKLEQKMKDAILDSTTYSGVKFSKSKTLSASGLNDDILPLVLKYRHGLGSQKVIEQNTLGTLLHSGLENAFNGHKDYGVEKSFKMPIGDTGWSLTGHVDLIDFDSNAIIDHKMLKTKKINEIMMMSQPKKKLEDWDDYQWQLGVYKLLAETKYGKTFESYISAFNKETSYFKKDADEVSFRLIPIVTPTNEEVMAKAISQVNEIKKYIDDNNDNEPSQCSNLFFSLKYGKPARPMRCRKFCDNSNHCTYYQKFAYHRKKASASDLLSKLGI